MTNIYVLRLEGGRYYVGKTTNVMKRYEEHLNGEGSAWTRKYKPISVHRVFENASPFDEDKITKEYMNQFGVDNVRGGSYVEIVLSDFHKQALQMEMNTAKGLCIRCGRGGHFMKDCWTSSITPTHQIISQTARNEKKCNRCGRTGHVTFHCYATTHANGDDIDSLASDDDYTDSEYDEEEDCDEY